MGGSEMAAPAGRFGSNLDLRELRYEIEEFNTAYAEVLDAGRVLEWPAFFTENGFYRIRARENADADLPAGLVYCEGLAMIKDRAFAIAHTAMFAPRYLMHMVSNVCVLDVDGEGVVSARANYLLLQTLVDEDTRIHQAGRYHDRFVRREGRLLLRSRDCVYDSLMVDNALVYPV
jgi:anthranilate 1,2-dioxygenase small subunit